MLDYRGPFIPGDVGNATTYRYPVLFKVVKGLTFDRVLAADKEVEADIIEAARELERFGVRGISSDCGFLVQYQRAVASAVRIPVFMSSLLQIPSRNGSGSSDAVKSSVDTELGPGPP